MEDFEDDIQSPEFSPIGSPMEPDEELEEVSKSKSIKIKIRPMIRKKDFMETSKINKSLNSDLVHNENEPIDYNSKNEDSVEEIRRKNIEVMNALLNSLRNPVIEQELSTNQASLNHLNKTKLLLRPKKKKRSEDSTFRFSGLIPCEIRKSSRLQKKNPDYKEDDLENIQETLRTMYFKRPNYNINDYTFEELEDIIYRPKRESQLKRKSNEHIIPVEEVTQAMLDNIALRFKGKVYSQDGTTCHQCRQKTLDQKTCCRNYKCSGIQGMFCGVCIKNRYGEEAAVALRDPNWHCPVCRGICNCSICRTKQGKRPTGVLVPLCRQQGLESVNHFLIKLKGQGDRPEEDHKWLLEQDNEALLGFSDEGRKMHFMNRPSIILNCRLCLYNECQNPKNFLGFSEDKKTALMGGQKMETIFF